MKMRQVDHKVGSIVADLFDTRIFPTEKMTRNTSNLFHNSANLLCSNDPVIKFSSQYIASAMSSPHYTKFILSIFLYPYMELDHCLLQVFNRCLKKCTPVN